MRVIIFGLGSIGQRHARLLLRFPGIELFAFRSQKEKQPNELGIREVFSWDEVKRLKPEVALITNPPNLHIETALKCANLGMHLFIEKPLSHTLKGLNQLRNLCLKKGLTCYVGYCLRFHPVIKKLKMLLTEKKTLQARVVCASYLPEWRLGRPGKTSYSAIKSAGGGVLLDLSHEFDYIQYLFGPIKSLNGCFGRYAKVTKDAEDAADLLIKLKNKGAVNLHLDVISRFTERNLKIDFANGYILADLLSGKIVYFWAGRQQTFKIKVDRDKYFREQLEYFFNRLGTINIMNNLDEAIGLLKLILRFKHA